MYKRIYLKYTKDEKPDVVSYGIKKGSFLTNNETMMNYALDSKYNELYCFVPIKTEYYTLIWDFDFKIDKCIELNNYINCFDEITNFIISNINDVLNETFTNPNIEYVYADKNKGYGVHLYFPNIIVNKNLHSYLFHKILQKINIKNMYPDFIIKHIFDSCVSNANGLRFFYYIYKECYYKPNKDLSTYKFDDDPKKHFKLCLINTNETNVSPKLKINNDDIETLIFNIDKKQKKDDETKNIIKNNIEYINDFKYLNLDNKKEMFIELSNILKYDRIDDYNDWIKLIYLFKTYGLYNEIIEFSKKSPKFDNNSIKIINNIFNKKRVPKDIITIGSLIKYASEDNFFKTIQILEKYDIHLKLNITNVDEILQLNCFKDISYKEESKYISDNAINEMITLINSNKKNVLLLQSATGSGKTTAIKKILLSQKSNKYSVLCIVTRRSMASTIISAFNYKKDKEGNLIKDDDFKFVSYLDENINSDEQFISSLEHLVVFKQFYDVVILDEIFSLCSYFYSDTLIGRRRECLFHLKNLISNAKIVIGADAQIADICFQLFPEKNIYFYKNTFKNKLNIPFDINIATNSSDNSNLTKISQIIGDKYCEKNKSVLVFSDRKETTIKIFELLKMYNRNLDYFRLFNADCGTLDDLNNIDEISKNRCLIMSPKVIYGLDITTVYDEIFCIYTKVKGTNSMSSFEWYQQLSRARVCGKVNVYILDSNVDKYYNNYISFDKNKQEEDKHIDNYIYYTESLCKKYEKYSDIINVDNNYFKYIHYYKSWYNKLFSKNKLQILILLAQQFGYNVNKINFDSSEIKSNLNQKVAIINNLKKKLSYKLLINEEVDEDIYKHYIPNLNEQIANRQKYISITNPDYYELVSDENKFKNYIKKKLLDLSKDKFEKKLLKVNEQDVNEIIKDNLIFNQIESLFWLEKQLNIERYEVDKIDININIANIKNILNDGVDKLFHIYNDNRSTKYINERIKKIISKINNHNTLQKFYADSVNNICEKVIKINIIKKSIKSSTFYYYEFIK